MDMINSYLAANQLLIVQSGSSIHNPDYRVFDWEICEL